jgi:hypothetical protein
LKAIIYVLGVVQVGGLAAQAAPIAWQPLRAPSSSYFYASPAIGPLSPQAFRAEPPDTGVRQIKPTYWKEGGVVGAVVVGTSMTLLVVGLCREGDGADCHPYQYVLGPLFSAALGFGLGALVGGGQFRKHPRSLPAEPT